MKKKKRFLGILLSLCLVISMLPTTVFAADQTNDGAGVRITEESYDSETGIMVLNVQTKQPNTEGIASVGTLISYDSSKLTLLHKSKDDTSFLPSEEKITARTAVECKLYTADEELFTTQEAALYGKDNRAGLYVGIGSVSGTNNSQKTTDWLTIYQLRFKVNGYASTVLDKNSIRIADPEKDAVVIEGAFPGSNDTVVFLVDGVTGNYYRWGKMKNYAGGELTDKNYLMNAEGNNTATYTGSTNIPPLPDQTFEAGFDGATVEKQYGTDTDFTKAANRTTGDGAVTYASNNTAVAEVDNAGKVTIKSAGSATITATAAETSNYKETSVSYTLTVKPVTITNISVADVTVSKTYDGTKSAGIVSGTVTFDGKVATDVVSIKAVAGEYADSYAGTAKTVTLTLSLDGAQKGNYKLDNGDLTKDITNGKITTATQEISVPSVPQPLTVGNTIDLKSVATSNAGEKANLVFTIESGGDKVQLQSDGTTIKGLAAGNAVINVNSATVNVDSVGDDEYGVATQKQITVNVSAKENIDSLITFGDKTVTYGDTFEHKATTTATGGSWTYEYVGTSADGSYTGGTSMPTVAGKYTVTAKYENSTQVGSKTATLKIEPKNVTITGVSASDKNYDGNKTAAITGTPAVSGKVGSDDVAVNASAASAEFADKNAGNGKNVTFSGYALTGTKALNYKLTAQPADVKANIKKAVLSITDATVTPKKYNGDTTAEVTAVTLTGTVIGETLTKDTDYTITGKFNSSDVAAANTVTVTVTLQNTELANNYMMAGAFSKPATISKADGPAAPASVTGSYAVSTTDNTKFVYTVNDISGAEYSKDGTTYQDSNVFDGIDPSSSPITFYARMKETSNVNAGAAGNTGAVTFNKLDNSNVPVLDYQVTGNSGNRKITVTPVTGAEYSFDGGVTWSDTNVKDGINDATVNVQIRYKATATLKASTSAAASVNTAKGTQTVSFEDTSALNKVYGNEDFTVTAVNDKNDGGKIVYSSTNTAVATVNSETGEVKIIGAGTAVIKASAEETAAYNKSADASYTLKVEKATITVTAKDKTAYVGGTAPDLTNPVIDTDYTVTGLVGTDTLSGTIKLEYAAVPDMTSAGTVAIVPSGVTANTTNYNDIIFENGTLTISKKSTGGGGSVIPTYSVVIDKTANGTVSAEPASAAEGKTITLTVKADSGYELDQLTVKDKDGKEVKVTGKDDKYTFTMPASKVNVAASFKEKASETGLPFTDVKEGDWFYDSVEYVYNKGMMNGIEPTLFGPSNSTTRGMIVTILYRMEGEPSVSGNAFADVKSDMYYAAAINWAAENGIVKGYGDGNFGPEDAITREQMSNILMNYAKYKGADVTDRADLSRFSDVSQISSWAEASLAWANAEGLINGNPDNTVNPGGNAERAQVAAILERFDAAF